MGGPPGGTVTFLFTDIEGSTRLLRATGDRYAALLDVHHNIIRGAIAAHDGYEMGTEGDSFAVAFARPSDALNTAVDAQLGLAAHDWSAGQEVRVRMGIHTGEASVIGESYVGLAVHEAARVSSAAHGGQILLSLTTVDLLRDALPPETSLLDLGFHRLKDFEHRQQLFQLVHPRLRRHFDAPTSVGAFATNLPPQLTSFVGREDDVDECRRLILSSRLVTLTGAGGVGKTRLSVEVATTLAGAYRDGVWMADLAPIAEPSLVAQAVASAVGLPDAESASKPWLDRVVDHLRDKSTLLLLDNCEHVVDACADLVETLMRECPQLRVLATTREPLELEGEQAWRVPSLPVLDDADHGAVRLFVERAREINATYSPNVGVIAEICRHLDGIPLAIELAAARTQALSTSQILDRLADVFQLLSGRTRRRVQRHQTLRATIDWSYELLDEAERALLRRTSVFAGGFTLEAAEAVCAGDVIDATGVLELLEGLVRKSLVNFDVDDERRDRYRMLETIRQYALEKLVGSGEAATLRERHRHFFRALAEQCYELTVDGRDIEAADAAEAEFDNLRAALDWKPPDDDGQSALVICGSLSALWGRGYASEGLQRTCAALDADTGPGTSARLIALATAGACAFPNDLAEVDRINRITGEGLALAEALDERPEDAPAHSQLLILAGAVALVRDSDAERAFALVEEALAIGRRADSLLAIAWAVYHIGAFKAGLGDLDGAAAAYEDALALSAGQDWVHMFLPAIASLRLECGDVPKARALAEDALAYARRARYPFAELRAFGVLAAVATAEDDLKLAHACAEEQIAIGRRIGDLIHGVALGLDNLVAIHVRNGDFAAAAASAEQAREIFTGVSPADAAMLDCALGEFKEVLGDTTGARAAYEQALDTNRRLSEGMGTVRALGMARALEGLAALAAKEDDLEEVVRLCAEIDDVRAGRDIARPRWWSHLPLEREAWIEKARASATP